MYGKSNLVHAFMGALAHLATMKPFMMSAGCRFLIFEFSTMPINLHWMLVKTGYKGTKRLFINDFFGLVFYFTARVCMGPYISYIAVSDMSRTKFPIGKRFFTLAYILMGISNYLNYYWFYKLVRSYYYSIRGIEKPKKKKAA